MLACTRKSTVLAEPLRKQDSGLGPLQRHGRLDDNGARKLPLRALDIAISHGTNDFYVVRFDPQMEMRLEERRIFGKADVELIGDSIRIALLGRDQPIGLRQRLMLGNGGGERENLWLVERKNATEFVLGCGGRDAYDVHGFYLHGHVVAIERGGVELERSAGRDGVLVGGRVQPQAGTKRDGFVQFVKFESDERIMHGGHQSFGHLFRLKKLRNGSSWIGWIERPGSFSGDLSQRRAARNAIPGNIDAVENIFGCYWAGLRDQEVLRRSLALGRAHALAAMHAARHAGDFGIRVAQHRIIVARIDADAIGHLLNFFALLLSESPRIPHQALGLPGLHPLQLLWKSLGIGSHGERLPAQNRGRLVLAVAIARSAAEAQDDDVGTEAPDHPDHIAQNFFAAPFLETFLGRFGESEIDGAGEELFRAVDTPGREQLLGANDAELVALFGADEVLTALAAGQREIAGAHFSTTRQIGEQRGVFVIGMRGNHEHAADDVEAIERKTRLGRSGQLALRECRRNARSTEKG